MGAMRTLTTAADGLVEVVGRNGFWMTWNLLLALFPAVLAPAVFRHRGTRTAAWWAGAALVLLFLPNAPYVITDLVHLRGDVLLADTNMAVVYAVLPVYGAFVVAGFASYAVVLSEMRRYLAAGGLARWALPVEVVLHALCAVGVVLGRVARLNSWEPVTEPHSTAERILLTLSWRWAPVAIAATFVTIWACHALFRTVARATWSVTSDVAGGARSALERWVDPGPA